MPTSGSFTGFGEPLAPGPVYSPTAGGSSIDFGLDVSTFPALDPSFGPMSGPQVVAQAVARRLRTPRGLLTYHPDYGFDLRQFVNADIGPADLHGLRAAIQREAEKDERVIEAPTTLVFNQALQQMTVTVLLRTGQGPFKLVLTVDQLNVSDNLG